MPTTTVVARRCNACGQHKLLTEFHKKPSGKYGRMARCATCVNAERRARSTAAKRADVTVRIHPKLRDALNHHAAQLDVPTKWLANHLLGAALHQLARNNLTLPDNAPRRRHRNTDPGMPLSA